MSQFIDWDATWTAIDTNLSISTGSDDTSDALSLDGKVAAELSVKAVYAAGSPTQGLKVHILRDTDGTNYEAEADLPFSFSLPYSGGGTHPRTFSLDAARVSAFKVLLTNDSGVTVTATTKIRYAVIGSS